MVVLDWLSIKSTAKRPLLRTSSGFRTRLLVMSAVLKRRVPWGGGPAELEPPEPMEVILSKIENKRGAAESC